MKVGLLGAGDVADQYVAGMSTFKELELVTVADADAEVGRRRSGEWGLRALSPEQLLADDEIELIVNLTPPRAHAHATRAALLKGKHVYSEKPLAVHLHEGRELVQLARRRDLGLGCAPDTFLGSALETARGAVCDGTIGTPIAALAFVGNPGTEHWHPAPEAYYEQGGGPLFSLGPYYLSALVRLLGPIEEVTGFSSRPGPTRTVDGVAAVPVSTDTTYCSAIRFVDGAVATLFASYDVEAASVPPIEIYGTTATLRLPDPNRFDGPVLLGRANTWRVLPPGRPSGYARGVGVAELARAIGAGRDRHESAILALHVLDAMGALSEGGRRLMTG